MIKMNILLRRSKLLIKWQRIKDNGVLKPNIYAIVSVNKYLLLANKN